MFGKMGFERSWHLPQFLFKSFWDDFSTAFCIAGL